MKLFVTQYKIPTWPSFFVAAIFSVIPGSLKLEDDGKSLKEVSNTWLKSDINYTFDQQKPKSIIPYSPAELSLYEYEIPKVVDNLKNFRKFVNSEILFEPENPKYQSSLKTAEKWEFQRVDYENWNEWENNSTICKVLKKRFSFFAKPLTLEEAEYALAYGMLVYKDLEQLLHILSAFYHPQNAYCIAIDDKASEKFKLRMQQVSKCFPNVHVYRTREVEYGGRQITVSVISCLQKLADSNHPWKYYQYLSGFDLPLKTNLEMVKIFKVLNGTFHASVEVLPDHRYSKIKGAKEPLPLWKSSLSATFSREYANAIVKNPLTYKLLEYLYDGKTHISDETIWTTVAGNPDHFKMPGGFNAKDFLEKILDGNENHTIFFPEINPNNNNHPFQRFPLYDYYISRYQVWNGGKQNCTGTYVNDSCVFGIGDLPELLKRPELVAHKFYLKDHPAAFFALYENIRLRALNLKIQKAFDASYYSFLPQVQLSKGKSIDEINFYF